MLRQTKGSGAMTVLTVMSTNAVLGKMSLIQAAQQKKSYSEGQFIGSTGKGKTPLMVLVNFI